MKKIENIMLYLGLVIFGVFYFYEIEVLLYISFALVILSSLLSLYRTFTKGTKDEKIFSVIALFFLISIFLYKYGKSLF